MVKNRLIVMVLIAIASAVLFAVFSLIHPIIISKAARTGDIFYFLNIYVLSTSLSRFFLGIFIGVVTLPIVVFFVAPLFGLEVSLEKRLRISNVVIMTQKPKTSILSVFLYAYILFGPTVILVRIATTIKSGDMIVYYLAFGDVMLSAMPYLLVFLVVPCIIRDLSCVRSLKSNLTIGYPSKLLQLILLIIVGVGSIASLAPMYKELLDIVHDPNLALGLFIYAIMIGFMPAFCMVVGYIIGAIVISRQYFYKSIEKFEQIVYRIGKAQVIVIKQK